MKAFKKVLEETHLIVIIFLSLFLVALTSRERSDDVVSKIESVTYCGTFGDYVPDYLDTAQQIAPRLPNLGTLHHPVTTTSTRAQEFFNQGLKLCYAFNFKEAHRSFMEAARLDPDCAMAYWGQAFALGPNINGGMPAERELRAYDILQKAVALKEKVSGSERKYIEALTFRYSNNAHDQRKSRDSSYMKQMKEVANQYPDDADAQSLYADAIMNTMPWQYWDKNGDYVPLAKEAKSILETALKKFPSHPALHHSYIHLVEASNNPYEGVPSADKLESLMPGAGHIIHMPSHIYIRTGHFDKAVDYNERSIQADEAYIAACQVEGSYALGYYPHNIHFLSFAASMLGQSAKAISASNKLLGKFPAGSLETLKSLQKFQVAHYDVNVRFGKWDEILVLPPPGEKLLHSQVIYHFAKGIAFARKGKMVRCKKEIHILDSLSRNEEVAKQMADDSSLKDVCLVAVNILKGEQMLDTNPAQAIEFLKQAREHEKTLIYSEPPTWTIPVNHFLGNALLKTERYKEAEQVFRADQKMFPTNGWTLMGLYRSLKGQDKTKASLEVLQEFKKQWKAADVAITSSVF